LQSVAILKIYPIFVLPRHGFTIAGLRESPQQLFIAV